MSKLQAGMIGAIGAGGASYFCVVLDVEEDACVVLPAHGYGRCRRLGDVVFEPDEIGLPFPIVVLPEKARTWPSRGIGLAELVAELTIPQLERLVCGRDAMLEAVLALGEAQAREVEGVATPAEGGSALTRLWPVSPAESDDVFQLHDRMLDWMDAAEELVLGRATVWERLTSAVGDALAGVFVNLGDAWGLAPPVEAVARSEAGRLQGRFTFGPVDANGVRVVAELGKSLQDEPVLRFLARDTTDAPVGGVRVTWTRPDGSVRFEGATDAEFGRTEAVRLVADEAGEGSLTVRYKDVRLEWQLRL